MDNPLWLPVALLVAFGGGSGMALFSLAVRKLGGIGVEKMASLRLVVIIVSFAPILFLPCRPLLACIAGMLAFEAIYSKPWSKWHFIEIVFCIYLLLLGATDERVTYEELATFSLLPLAILPGVLLESLLASLAVPMLVFFFIRVIVFSHLAFWHVRSVSFCIYAIFSPLLMIAHSPLASAIQKEIDSICAQIRETTGVQVTASLQVSTPTVE